jgi:hypothetical protein
VIINDTSRGFMVRNSLVASNCDYMIALTFHANVDELMNSKRGGTRDTFIKAKHLKVGATKVQICLKNL